MKIVALGGYAESGKDSFGDFLVENYGYKKFAFAESLKIECAANSGLDLKYFHHRELKDQYLFKTESKLRYLLVVIFSILFLGISSLKYGVLKPSLAFVLLFYPYFRLLFRTPRDIMIQYSKHCRLNDTQYFIKKTFDRISKNDKKVVISDCRMKEESDYIKKNYEDVSFVWINRSNYEVNKNDNTQVNEKEFDVSVDNLQTPFDGKNLIEQIENKIVF